MKRHDERWQKQEEKKDRKSGIFSWLGSPVAASKACVSCVTKGSLFASLSRVISLSRETTNCIYELEAADNLNPLY